MKLSLILLVSLFQTFAMATPVATPFPIFLYGSTVNAKTGLAMTPAELRASATPFMHEAHLCGETHWRDPLDPQPIDYGVDGCPDPAMADDHGVSAHFIMRVTDVAYDTSVAAPSSALILTMNGTLDTADASNVSMAPETARIALASHAQAAQFLSKLTSGSVRLLLAPASAQFNYTPAGLFTAGPK